MPTRHVRLTVTKPSNAPVEIAVPHLSNFVLRGRSELQFNGVTHVEGDAFTLDIPRNTLCYSGDVALEQGDTLHLRLEYSSVISYRSFFHWLQDAAVEPAATRYYEELEKSVANECWLAASVLCGSLAEAILFDVLKTRGWTPPSGKLPTLGVIIGDAGQRAIITPAEVNALRAIADARNTLHAAVVAGGTAPPDREIALRGVAFIERFLHAQSP